MSLNNNNNSNNLNIENDDLEDERNFEALIQNDIQQQQELEQQQQQNEIINEGNINIEINNNQNNEYLEEDENNIDDNDDEYEDIDDEDEEEDDDVDVDEYNEALEAFVDIIREVSDNDDYDSVKRPNQINFDTALPATHNYLGENFEDVSAPKVVLEQNELITLPIIALPGAQLLPGQIMPLCVYAPTQINMIKNRLEDVNRNPTIGFIIRPELETTNEIIGTLAEIISCKNEENDQSATGMALLLKVKGRERFKVIKIRHDITGCTIADIKIMPEFILNKNPLKYSAPRNTEYIFDNYFSSSKPRCSLLLAESLNTTPYPAWLYRQYDCTFIMNLILKEIKEDYDIPSEQIPIEPILFSNWILNNFPFDDQLRLKIIKLDCINQRLRFIHSILKHYSSINCRLCRAQICQKSDVFSMSVHGFMSAYVNPNGYVHETLTVYKAKNLSLIGRPSTEFSWFPGYAWTIVQCRQCGNHIGWKFTATKSTMVPDKFWGLTRKSVCHAQVEFNKTNNTASGVSHSLSNDSEDNWIPII